MNEPSSRRSPIRAVIFDFYGTLAEAPDWGPSWGEVLAVQPEGPGVVMARLDRQRTQDVRRQLPALTHRVMQG